MWSELAVALGLIFVIEGVVYSLFPNAIKRMLAQILTLSDQSLRAAGLFSAILGVVWVWLLRG